VRFARIALALVALAAPAFAHDWNDANIAWKSLDDGLPLAKKEQKPICLIVFTEWCPHCKNYSQVFHDPKVVEKAKQFVMIHADQDKEKDKTAAYAPDGGYIPRTLFLNPDGTLNKDVHAPRPQYQYFYDEKDPVAVLAGMDEALKKPQASKPADPAKK
jgi:thiol:disulfide interchange protein